MNKKYPQLGALKDPVDKRDITYAQIIKVASPLPPVFDLENKCTPVKDQGQRGSCVAFAAVGTKEQHLNINGVTVSLSEEFLYDQIMQRGGGAYPRSAYRKFEQQGAILESELPYNPNEQDEKAIHLKPTPQQLTNAAQYKTKGYARLKTTQMMKQSLVQNGAFLIGVDWLEGWMNPTNLDENGYPILDVGEGEVAGGHGLCVVGYDDNRKLFKFKNSWGNTWGKNGYAYFTYAAIEQNLNDAWSEIEVSSPHIATNVFNLLREEASNGSKNYTSSSTN